MNFASQENGVRVVGCTSEDHSSYAWHVLRDEENLMWLSEEKKGMPQHIVLDVSTLLTLDPPVSVVGWRCCREFTTNPRVVKVSVSPNGTEFSTIAYKLCEFRSGSYWMPLRIPPDCPFLRLSILETFGSEQTYLNQIMISNTSLVVFEEHDLETFPDENSIPSSERSSRRNTPRGVRGSHPSNHGVPSLNLSGHASRLSPRFSPRRAAGTPERRRHSRRSSPVTRGGRHSARSTSSQQEGSASCTPREAGGSSGDGNLGEVSSTDAKLVLLETDSASSSSSNLSLSQEDTVDESGVVPPADGAPVLLPTADGMESQHVGSVADMSKYLVLESTGSDEEPKGPVESVSMDSERDGNGSGDVNEDDSVFSDALLDMDLMHGPADGCLLTGEVEGRSGEEVIEDEDADRMEDISAFGSSQEGEDEEEEEEEWRGSHRG